MNIDRQEFLGTLAEFPASARSQAKVLLDWLDPSLSPEVTVVAIPLEDGEVIIRSTGSNTYDPGWFDSLRAPISFVRESDLSSLAQDVRGMIWQSKVEIKQSAQEVLDEIWGSSETRGFTIFPAFLHGYCVFMILEVARSILNRPYRLSKNAIRPYPKETSLIHEVIIAFLYASLKPLDNVGQGRQTFFLHDKGRETLRTAGFSMMQTPERACGNHAQGSLFRAFNTISSIRYEGAEGHGGIVIGRRKHPDINILVTLIDEVHLSNHRAIRKLLETTIGGNRLLYDSAGIYGIGRINRAGYNPEKEDLFEVLFQGSHFWKLLHNEQELMCVKHGLPGLSQSRLRMDEFTSTLLKQFPDIDSEDIGRLWKVTDRATDQAHGTMLVVSDQAASEAERLSRQSTLIEPIPLTEELAIPLSSIDGAIMIEPNSTCHAVGVILDGLVTEYGDPARGARYNSALRYKSYVTELGHACLIIVVSEDGTVDLI